MANNNSIKSYDLLRCPLAILVIFLNLYFNCMVSKIFCYIIFFVYDQLLYTFMSPFDVFVNITCMVYDFITINPVQILHILYLVYISISVNFLSMSVSQHICLTVPVPVPPFTALYLLLFGAHLDIPLCTVKVPPEYIEIVYLI